MNDRSRVDFRDAFENACFEFFPGFDSEVAQGDAGHLAEKGLEARYNYENLRTGSLWFGYNLRFGKNVTLDLTPMLGGVFGNTNGVAPGYTMTVGYKRLELFSEGEYVINTNETANRYFYAWDELSYSPVKWFRFGGVAERTRLYQTPLDVQRGFLVGLNYKKLEFTTYVFDPGVTGTRLEFAVAYAF